MKYKLRYENKQGERNQPLETILLGRGIPKENFHKFIHPTEKQLIDPEELGKNALENARRVILRVINENKKAIVCVDSDQDGGASAALIMNYLYDINPQWATTKLDYFIHKDKEHGIGDCVDYFETEPGLALVIIPDASSSEWEFHNRLIDKGIDVVVLDHHEAEPEDIARSKAIIINNQICDYDNKALSGTAVTWKLCQYMDKQEGTNYSEDYYDLVGLSIISDMMDYTQIESKYLVDKGVQNLKNPFITELAKKNAYSIGPEFSSISYGFNIAPYYNATIRSGDMAEKKLVFESFLKSKAYTQIPSTKRGHKFGETETLVEQAVRVASNVKSRQTKARDLAIQTLEEKIEEEGLLENKALLFLLHPGEVHKNLAGLVCTQFANKYSKPTMILTSSTDETGQVYYSGSARGCDKTGVKDFKTICENTGVIEYARGHQGAFGLSIKHELVPAFMCSIDKQLKDIKEAEAVYEVDFILDRMTLTSQMVLELASYKSLWGMNFPEIKVAVKNILVSPDMVEVYEKNNITIKIKLNNGVTLMKFKASPQEAQRFKNENFEITVVGSCNKNEWQGAVTPQIFIDDYEIVKTIRYIF